MEKTIITPVQGEHVTQHGDGPVQQPAQETGFINGQYQPPSKRTTLHNTRLGPILAARQAEAKAPAPQPSHVEALSQQMATLQTAVNALAVSHLANRPQPTSAPERDTGTLDKLMAHNRYGSGPYTGESQPYDIAPDQPDPLNHDFYDPDSTADYHRLNNDYIQREVQRQRDAERVAQQNAAQGEEWARQGNHVRAKFGRDANFDEALLAAAGLIIDSGYKLTVEDAYLQASNEIEARSGKRGSSYLPKDVKTLGAIQEYREQTGRSRR